jgi:hypothetical protein
MVILRSQKGKLRPNLKGCNAKEEEEENCFVWIFMSRGTSFVHVSWFLFLFTCFCVVLRLSYFLSAEYRDKMKQQPLQ